MGRHYSWCPAAPILAEGHEDALVPPPSVQTGTLRAVFLVIPGVPLSPVQLSEWLRPLWEKTTMPTCHCVIGSVLLGTQCPLQSMDFSLKTGSGIVTFTEAPLL